jgi:hypothetical protein
LRIIALKAYLVPLKRSSDGAGERCGEETVLE